CCWSAGITGLPEAWPRQASARSTRSLGVPRAGFAGCLEDAAVIGVGATLGIGLFDGELVGQQGRFDLGQDGVAAVDARRITGLDLQVVIAACAVHLTIVRVNVG